MDREILFRAKRVCGDEWIEGYYLSCYYPGNSTDQIGHFIVEYPGKYHEIYKDTLCQYTGLTDKNGKKIFEGDILSAHLDDQHLDDITYVKITWNGFSWCMRESTEDDVMSEFDCNTFEVCGNIFDNPELIGGI